MRYTFACPSFPFWGGERGALVVGFGFEMSLHRRNGSQERVGVSAGDVAKVAWVRKRAKL